VTPVNAYRMAAGPPRLPANTAASSRDVNPDYVMETHHPAFPTRFPISDLRVVIHLRSGNCLTAPDFDRRHLVDAM